MFRIQYVFILLLFVATNLLANVTLNNGTKACASSIPLYNFMQSEEVRRDWYQSVREESPFSSVVIDSWNRLLTDEDTQDFTEMTQVSPFIIFRRVSWADGAQLQVVKHPTKPMLNVIKRTVLDCHGNTIPTSIEELPERYVFGSVPEWQAFRQYILSANGSEGVDFPSVQINSNNKSIEVQCRRRIDDRYECITFAT